MKQENPELVRLQNDINKQKSTLLTDVIGVDHGWTIVNVIPISTLLNSNKCLSHFKGYDENPNTKYWFRYQAKTIKQMI